MFFYVSSATVDLSVFGGDQALLIQSLQSAHRSIRFKPLLHQRKATIEGPFAAIQALREDLICRASQLKPRLSAQSAAAKLRKSSPETKENSHRECLSPVSCRSSKAKLELASSNSLLAMSQATSKASQIHNFLTNTKIQKHSVQQKVSTEDFPVGSFYNTDNIKEVQTAQSSTQLPREYSIEQSKASPGQMFAGIKSSISGLDLLPAQQISAKHPKVGSISQNVTRPGRNSETKFKGKVHLGSCYSSIDYLNESDQSSSAVTAKPLQTGLQDVSLAIESSIKDTEEVSTEYPCDSCLFVDSHTFRYIKKFDRKAFSKCVRGLAVSVVCVQGTELMQVFLAEKETSGMTSRIQKALEKLSNLVALHQSKLRVYEICYDPQQNEKHTLIQICDEVNLLYDDVLYVMEDQCIKLIGPLISTLHFSKRVEDRIEKLKDKSLTWY